jgi:predicted RNase H-like nuclease
MTMKIAGIDGCPAGWIAAIALVDDLTAVYVRVFSSIHDLVAEGPFAKIAVDMPIGLPDRVGPGGRGPERAVRPLLGERRSSVFSVPARRAVYAPDSDYLSACREAFAASDPPRKVSKQCFHIFPKIREIDGLLRDCRDLLGIVHEVHPEVAFWRLNGQRPLAEPKKLKGRRHLPGLDERRKLLAAAGIASAVLAAAPPRGAAVDDLLDALVGLVIAWRLHRGLARPFPDPPDHDAFG